MRARELFEDYNQNLLSDLTNLLIGAKGSGATEVKTQDVVNQLYGMGYAVNVNSIITLLGDNPAVMNATPEMITLTQPEGTASGMGDDQENSEDQVADMAQQATQKGIQ
jgi:hypothetical protein